MFYVSKIVKLCCAQLLCVNICFIVHHFAAFCLTYWFVLNISRQFTKDIFYCTMSM